MGFGGGGGSVGVGNHVHSNAVGEGGSLTSASTLIDNGLIQSRILIGV